MPVTIYPLPIFLQLDDYLGESNQMIMSGDHSGVSGVIKYSLPEAGINQGSRWPNGVVPYVIPPRTPNQDLVANSIKHIAGRTQIRFVRLSKSSRASYPNYLVFTSEENGRSLIGMQGGCQTIALGRKRNFNLAVQLILRALGLSYGNDRAGRCECTGSYSNHSKLNCWPIFSSYPVSQYMFNSSVNDDCRNIEETQSSVSCPDFRHAIRLRQGMSLDDIAAINALYAHVVEPLASWNGVQIQGEIAPHQNHCWLTHSWPCNWFVHWSVVTTAAIQAMSAQLDWSVQVEKQSKSLLKYFIAVKNLGDVPMKVEVRYTLLG